MQTYLETKRLSKNLFMNKQDLIHVHLGTVDENVAILYEYAISVHLFNMLQTLLGLYSCNLTGS